MPVRKIKKITSSLITYAKPIAFLCLFAYFITQPYLFVVEKEENNTEIVQAAYQDLLDQATAPQDGSIQFETLIVGENGEATISYGVTAGDNLGSIAKSFGTSVEAIMAANNLDNANKLRPGQKLVIAYDDGVIVNVRETITLRDFTRSYELDQQEFLSMNYFEDQDMTLEEGRQVFVPLNQIEAEKKGLIEKQQFVKLDLDDDKEDVVQVVVNDVIEPEPINPEEANDDTDKVELTEEQIEYQQVVITAKQTQEHLKNLEQAKLDAIKAAEEAKARAIEQERLAEEARIRNEKEKTEASKRAAAEAKRKAAEQKKLAEQASQRAEAERKKQAEAQAQANNLDHKNVECSSNQCGHKGKCWNKPAKSTCSPSDPSNAWVCNAGLIEWRGTCIDKNSQVVQAPKRSPGTLEQRYFNPHKVDSNVYGRGPGHCTAMAAYLWSQNYGIRIRDYWTGNAKDRLANARNAGFVVNSTPAPGSLMVSGSGYGTRGPYGHVMYVESVDAANGLVTVVDMNYKGRYIATKRTEAINKAKGFIHPK